MQKRFDVLLKAIKPGPGDEGAKAVTPGISADAIAKLANDAAEVIAAIDVATVSRKATAEADEVGRLAGEDLRPIQVVVKLDSGVLTDAIVPRLTGRIIGVT